MCRPLERGPAGQADVVHGVEISGTMLASGQRRLRRQVATGNLQLNHASMQGMPLVNGALDAVVSTNTVYFVDDLTAALAEFAGVLRSEGRLVLGIEDPEAMAMMPFAQHGFRLRHVSEIITHLHDAGFQHVAHLRLNGAQAAHVFVSDKDRSGGPRR